MKIFAVYARVKLLKKPDWLDDFRFKYDDRYDFHVTLKQPCFINEEQIPPLKEKLNQIFSNFYLPDHKINILFNKKTINNEVEGKACIMILAKNKDICNLQSIIKSSLSDYKNYYESELEKYENNFNPHITISRNLDSKTLSMAVSEIKDDFLCEGTIEEIVLVVVNEKTAEETTNPKNFTVYRL